MNIGIDTEKLNAQIDKLEKTKNEIKNSFQTINTETNAMKESYDSKTSEVIYTEFDRFNKAAEDYIDDLDAYINYLKMAVNQSYIDYEDKENKLIDENIATN
jgi:uncharacterized protein YukE